MRLELKGPILESRFSIGQRGNLNGQPIFAKRPTTKGADQFANELLFLKELQGITGILHPLDYIDGSLILPYVESDLLSRSFNFDVQRQVLEPLLKVLIELERRKIVHGDIKLQNVRITEKNEAFLTDFGKARSYRSHCPNYLDSISQHHAPDITLSGLSDLYSLGVLAYQLLVGPNYMRDFVFRGRSPEHLQQVPDHLSRFILRATDPSPLTRYQSASEALRSLKLVSEAEGCSVAKYDLDSSFEVYLEAIKNTFKESRHSGTAFDEFVGDHGAKYYARLENWSRREDALLIHIKAGSRIVGILEACVNRNGRAQISTLFVEEHHRGKGLAQILETEALSFFRKRGFESVVLNVTPTNFRAISFYRKNGWIEQHESHYPNSVQFIKQLHSSVVSK